MNLITKKRDGGNTWLQTAESNLKSTKVDYSLSIVGCFVKWHTTNRACGQVGGLKLICPNLCRYKLLMLSYLQMFSRFPSAETKVQ
jgi:hypothetical protein